MVTLFKDNSAKGSEIRTYNVITLERNGFEKSDISVKSGELCIVKKENGIGYYLVFGKQAKTKDIEFPSLQKLYKSEQDVRTNFEKRLKKFLKVEL